MLLTSVVILGAPSVGGVAALSPQADLRLTRGLLHRRVRLSAQPGSDRGCPRAERLRQDHAPAHPGRPDPLAARSHSRCRLGLGRPCGERVWMPPEQRRTGLVLADHLLFPHLSVIDNVGL